MPEQLSITFASNRGPLSFVRADGSYAPAPGVGAVAELLDLLGRSLGSGLRWIASAVSEDDRAAVRAGACAHACASLPYRAEYLAFEGDVYRHYYDEISNRILWFACHDLWDELGVGSPGWGWRDSWGGYDAANRWFAERVARRADPSSIALFHDYHLLTGPKWLKGLRPDVASGLFMHGAWSTEGFQRLPKALVARVVDGMLGADVVGFHTPGWGDEFLDTCEASGETVDRHLGTVMRDGRRTRVRAYPVPVDTDRVLAAGHRPEADRWVDRLGRLVKGKLIARADRVEPSKNALRGFQAFELALERMSEPSEATFVASLLPRRTTMDEYVRYRAQIERTVDDINARFPGSIRLFLGDDRERSFAAMRRADVIFVNSIRDGMNLVAKEGVILNERNAVLVISSTVGAATELGQAALVIRDPRDVAETAAVLERALAMPARERARRSGILRNLVMSHTPADWLGELVADLSDRGSETVSG